MLRYKQSSLCRSRGNAAASVGVNTDLYSIWWQLKPNEVASIVSFANLGGFGGWKRREPMGGDANGIPRYALTPGNGEKPRTWPEVVLTVGSAQARESRTGKRPK